MKNYIVKFAYNGKMYVTETKASSERAAIDNATFNLLLIAAKDNNKTWQEIYANCKFEDFKAE